MLYTHEFEITPDIKIHVPTIREILFQCGENKYFDMVSYFTATSYDLMLELEEAGIRYETVSDFDLFLQRFENLQQEDTSILFPDLDLTEFHQANDTETGNIVLWNGKDIVIDHVIFWQIANFFRQITHSKRNYEKMGNEEARRYVLEKLKKKRRRLQRKQQKSQSTFTTIEQCIISLVNTTEFHYDYNSVLDLTLIQFNSSLHQVPKKIHCDYMMTGVFMGTIDPKKNTNQLNWMMTDNDTMH